MLRQRRKKRSPLVRLSPGWSISILKKQTARRIHTVYKRIKEKIRLSHSHLSQPCASFIVFRKDLRNDFFSSSFAFSPSFYSFAWFSTSPSILSLSVALALFLLIGTSPRLRGLCRKNCNRETKCIHGKCVMEIVVTFLSICFTMPMQQYRSEWHGRIRHSESQCARTFLLARLSLPECVFSRRWRH